MKQSFTSIKILFSTLLLFGILSNVHAQEWTKNKSDLYYIGSHGKVFIEPDYSAMALYFDDDVIKKETGEI